MFVDTYVYTSMAFKDTIKIKEKQASGWDKIHANHIQEMACIRNLKRTFTIQEDNNPI